MIIANIKRADHMSLVDALRGERERVLEEEMEQGKEGERGRVL